jgi:hypothetical protein
MEFARIENGKIPHVVATAFALDLRHRKGRAILREYAHLGLETDAFKGPWGNVQPCENLSEIIESSGGRISPCGPRDVRGHRHDQTALSVCAWRENVPLTDPPKFFAYGKAGAEHDSETILIADGSYAKWNTTAKRATTSPRIKQR